MTYSAVDIFIRENNDLGNPIVGATVKILSTDGTQVYGQADTDTQGIASFLLPVNNYQARFFKFGVSFTNPMLLALDDAPQNKFNVYGVPRVEPESMDNRICLASGFFRTASGAPQRSLDIHFMPKFDPLLVEGSAILGERIANRTDDKGYMTVPLIRFAQYDVTIEGMENYFRSIEVPDTTSVNLPDLLFPVIEGVSFDGVDGTVALAVGEERLLQGHVFTSDKRELDELGSEVAWSQSNETVLSFELLPGSILKLRGLAAGSCQLLGERRDRTIIRIPNTPILGLPLQVTVT